MARQMRAKQGACAAIDKPVDWKAIDWRKVNRNVRRLQVRIVKATQEGRWGKVKALQRLLTHSFSGKAMAVRRVTENQGKHTPGVDGEIWNTPQKKAKGIGLITQAGYRPQPLRRIYIPKSNGKKRPLGIPTMKDRAMQALYLQALDPLAETTADPNSYGFRRERSTADAIGQCFRVLSQKKAAQWILEGDIRACFDQISHEWLLSHIPMDKVILRKWLKAGYLEKQAFHPTEAGTPQGGIISPLLANLALDGMEKVVRGKIQPNGNEPYPQINFDRYADDFFVTGNSRELLEEEIRPRIVEFLRERGLELSQEKTRITHISDGFDFLGQNVRKYNGKLIIKPAKENVQHFLAKIRLVIHENQTATAGHLIVRLNPLIRGWANYHRHVCSKQTFQKVDHAIFTRLWRWARRRHPKKGKRWIKSRYFKTVGGRNWVFSGDTVDQNGKKKNVRLTYAAITPIRRHVKVQARANPYDPEWEMYFERRLDKKMVQHLGHKTRLLNLWKAQDGKCPICRLKINAETGWHCHHILAKSSGGGEQMANLVLIHPECHHQVHSQRWTVVKPRPATGVTKA
jgi:RNA-directed DNA polymerase